MPQEAGTIIGRLQHQVRPDQPANDYFQVQNQRTRLHMAATKLSPHLKWICHQYSSTAGKTPQENLDEQAQAEIACRNLV